MTKNCKSIKVILYNDLYKINAHDKEGGIYSFILIWLPRIYSMKMHATMEIFFMSVP